jgi:hypothetical protein
MRIKTIQLDSNELPETIDVQMTREEGVLIANYVGGLLPSTPASVSIWDALTGRVFNRFWDDGLSDATRYRGESE